MVEIKRYMPQHPLLKRLVKCFWITSGAMPALNHKLLPIRNIDLIINLSPRPLVLAAGDAELRFTSCYCTGIMDHFRYCWRRPAGYNELVGVSFTPVGFYPFFGVPLAEFRNRMVDLQDLDRALSLRLVERLQEGETTPEKFLALEHELMAILDIDLIADARMESLIGEFAAPETVQIDAFCDRHGIHRRTFERFANRVIGANPKTCLKLNRFRRSLQALLDNGYHSLTEVAHACGYYDQMHFIREFKRFTGSAPSLFLTEKKALRQISFFS